MSTGRCVQSQLHGLSGQDQCSADSLLQGDTADHSEGEGLYTAVSTGVGGAAGRSECWDGRGCSECRGGRGCRLQ